MIKASSCVWQTEKVGYKSWVTYPRSHILYIEEPKFKPGATGHMLLAHGINLLSELHRWQIAGGAGRARTLSWYSLSRKPASQTKPISIGEGERQWEIRVYMGRIRVPAEGGAWVYLWAWTAHHMCVRSCASSVWSTLCLVLIGQRISSHCTHQ